MALFTMMPSIWLIVTMRFLTRESSTSSPAAVVAPSAPFRSENATAANAYPADISGVDGTKQSTGARGSPGGRLQHAAGMVVVPKKMHQALKSNRYRVRDAIIVPVQHQNG